MSDELKTATANAAAEAAKLGVRALDLVEGTGRFFAQILGPGFEHLGGGFSDWAATWRYKNAIMLGEKVDEIHRARGIAGATRPIEPRLAIPLIHAATAEDSDGLQDLWAGLIANATDPLKLTVARRDFVALLGGLEPLDARCLLEIQENEIVTKGQLPVDAAHQEPIEGRRAKRNVAWLAARLGVETHAVRISVEGLARHSLVVDRAEDPDDDAAGQVIVPVTHREADLWLSYTGRALLEACSHK